MKQMLFVFTLALAGFMAFIWLSQPVAIAPPSVPETASQPPAIASHFSPPVEVAPCPTNAPEGSDTPPVAAEVPTVNHAEILAQRNQDLIERKQAADQRRIEILVERLGLNLEQAAQLQDYCTAQRQKISELLNEDDADVGPNLEALAKILHAPIIPDEVLNPLLTPDQKVALGDYKAEEQTRSVHSQALKNFADFSQVVELSSDQMANPQLFQSFVETSTPFPATDPEAAGWQKHSVQIDPGTGRITTTYVAEPALLGVIQPSPPEAGSAIPVPELRQQWLERQYAALAPLLNETQRRDYFTYLQGKLSPQYQTVVSP